MSDPDLEPASLHIARTGTRMVWRQLEGSKVERGVIGPVEPDLLTRYLWEGRPSAMYFFCIGCAGDDVQFDHAEYERLFPLEIGKSVTFQRTIEQLIWTNTIAVSGTAVMLRAWDVDALDPLGLLAGIGSMQALVPPQMIEIDAVGAIAILQLKRSITPMSSASGHAPRAISVMPSRPHRLVARRTVASATWVQTIRKSKSFTNRSTASPFARSKTN